MEKVKSSIDSIWKQTVHETENLKEDVADIAEQSGSENKLAANQKKTENSKAPTHTKVANNKPTSVGAKPSSITIDEKAADTTSSTKKKNTVRNNK
ncbi:hypothetical protein HH214_19220 [Mucilaginibacter robiniae]|uniref:Uncharacterized protein n=1 Tax=Mucilaginibacter robiniae TaxID=2728022 RepID=A0A7L5E439_9SPHI|nr:hypothetical protein [Mucilaginibacter robiniae]QJD97855.1 hypothetical protein HH214_19220 [Mucilaginibacter robiniae]